MTGSYDKTTEVLVSILIVEVVVALAFGAIIQYRYASIHPSLANTGWEYSVKSAVANKPILGNIEVTSNSILLSVQQGSFIHSKEVPISSIIEDIRRLRYCRDDGDAQTCALLAKNTTYSINERKIIFVTGDLHYAVIPTQLNEFYLGPIRFDLKLHQYEVDISLDGAKFILPNSTGFIAYIDYSARISVRIVNTTYSVVKLSIHGTAYVRGTVFHDTVLALNLRDYLLSAPILDMKSFEVTRTYIIRGNTYSLPKSITLLVPSDLLLNDAYTKMVVKTANYLRELGINTTVKIVRNLTRYHGYIVLFAGVNKSRIVYDNTTNIKVISADSPMDAAIRLAGNIPGPFTWFDIHSFIHTNFTSVFAGKLGNYYIYIIP